MAYVGHHPDYRVPPGRAGWRETRAHRFEGIDGLWLTSFAFGAIVTLSALVFLVPMLLFG
jgi:hypothetical protein